jgi:hypothetical protein
MATLYLERILDANGDPVSGGRAYIYSAGTTTSVTPYADPNLATAHGNFVTANAAGEFPDTYVPAGTYDIRLTDADEAVLYERQDVIAGGGVTGNTPAQYGAAGDGVTDDTDAIVAWAADADNLIKSCTPGATYLCSAIVSGGKQISFAAGSQVAFNGAEIRFNETDASSNVRLAFADDCRVHGLRLYWTGNNYFKRAMTVGANCLLSDSLVQAETDQPAFLAEIRDHCVKIMGSNTTINGARFVNMFDCIRGDPDTAVSNVRIIDVTMERYASGISTQGSLVNSEIRGVRALSINANAEPLPGQNAITGACDGLTVADITIHDAPEHGIYLAGASVGVTVENVRVFGTGQCGFKGRNLTDFVIRDVRVANQHNATAAGENEDGIRLEECSNGSIHDFWNGDETGGGGAGYDNVHIDSCSDLQFFGVYLKSAWRSGIRIQDSRVEGSVSNIYFHGVVSEYNGNAPFLDISVTGNLGDIVLQDVMTPNLTNDVVQIDAAGTVGRVTVQGDVATTGTYIDNIAGGGGVEIRTPSTLYVGLNDPYQDSSGGFVPKQRFSSQAAFSPADATNSASLGVGSWETDTTAGTLGGALVFTKNSSNRPWGAIVAYQIGPDADQGGLQFYGRSATAPSNALDLFAQFELSGDFALAKDGVGVVLHSPDGTAYRVTVDNSGNLVTTAV